MQPVDGFISRHMLRYFLTALGSGDQPKHLGLHSVLDDFAQRQANGGVLSMFKLGEAKLQCLVV